jgi:hypothetical protein
MVLCLLSLSSNVYHSSNPSKNLLGSKIQSLEEQTCCRKQEHTFQLKLRGNTPIRHERIHKQTLIGSRAKAIQSQQVPVCSHADYFHLVHHPNKKAQQVSLKQEHILELD